MGRGIFLITLSTFHTKPQQNVLHNKEADDVTCLICSLQIHDGIVIYVCFYKGAMEKIIPKMGK